MTRCASPVCCCDSSRCPSMSSKTIYIAAATTTTIISPLRPSLPLLPRRLSLLVGALEQSLPSSNSPSRDGQSMSEGVPRHHLAPRPPPHWRPGPGPSSREKGGLLEPLL